MGEEGGDPICFLFQTCEAVVRDTSRSEEEEEEEEVEEKEIG